MNAQQIEKKLEIMNGKAYEYAKEFHVVKGYSINNEKECFVIKTDKSTFDRKFESAKTFFTYWYEQPSNMAIEKASKLLPQADVLNSDEVVKNTNNLADDLVEILKKNIEKVSANPQYVNQAKAVDKSVDTIIKIKRMQLELYNAVNPRKRGNQ